MLKPRNTEGNKTEENRQRLLNAMKKSPYVEEIKERSTKDKKICKFVVETEVYNAMAKDLSDEIVAEYKAKVALSKKEFDENQKGRVDGAAVAGPSWTSEDSRSENAVPSSEATEYMIVIDQEASLYSETTASCGALTPRAEEVLRQDEDSTGFLDDFGMCFS